VQKRAEKCTHTTDFRSFTRFLIPSVQVGRKICPHALERQGEKQAARATPKGSLRLLRAGDAENAKQPGFYGEPTSYENREPASGKL
jgi:hypothetical protein